MSNVLEAICNIIEYGSHNVENVPVGVNRMNSVGESLESYISKAFANELHLTGRYVNTSNTFSYMGNNSNPPDSILRNGTAIEVKKIASLRSDLQLNSSYPKAYLYHNDNKLTTECKRVVGTNDLDMLYVVGTVLSGGKIKQLSFIYGHNYAADRSVYEGLFDTIKEGVASIPGIDVDPSNELARVNNVDPLGITKLRTRGMWLISNPLVLFENIYTPSLDSSFNIMCIVDNDKWYEMPEQSVARILSLPYSGISGRLTITDVQIENPNNPALMVDSKSIEYKV